MLPDFAKAKARARRTLLRMIEAQVPVAAPLLKGVAVLRQHEGRAGEITRADKSTSTTNYELAEFSITFTRDELKQPDPTLIVQKIADVARQMGDTQTRRMLEAVKEAADEVGNIVHADGELTQDKYLEIFRGVEMDFDPKTLKLLPGFTFVMHPELAAKVVPKIREWEQEPEFRAKYERMMDTKLEEWRDREACRKLVG